MAVSISPLDSFHQICHIPQYGYTMVYFMIPLFTDIYELPFLLS